MRAVLAWAYQIPQTSHELKQFNERFDRLLLSAEMKHANVMVNRRGAPLRIIRSSFFDGAGQDGSVLHDQSALVALIGQNTEHNYVMAQHKLNSGIIKSIIFLVITKVIIGLGIEIPLDIWLYGSVIYLPLMINLLSPPLFMLFQRLTLRMPKRRNTVAIQDYVKDMLYIDEDSQPLKSLQKSLGNSSGSRIFGWIYALFTLLTFGLVTYFLAVTGFNPIQGMIFFVFMSTATFLSFRLSLIIKDIELVSTNQNALSTIRDFVYIPFILLGQWLSGKYAQINIISTLLDLVIELPLKKVLRLTRQWVRFLEDKKETIV
jgi:hypothetical protein